MKRMFDVKRKTEKKTGVALYARTPTTCTIHVTVDIMMLSFRMERS